MTCFVLLLTHFVFEVCRLDKTGKIKWDKTIIAFALVLDILCWQYVKSGGRRGSSVILLHFSCMNPPQSARIKTILVVYCQLKMSLCLYRFYRFRMILFLFIYYTGTTPPKRVLPTCTNVSFCSVTCIEGLDRGPWSGCELMSMSQSTPFQSRFQISVVLVSHNRETRMRKALLGNPLYWHIVYVSVRMQTD